MKRSSTILPLLMAAIVTSSWMWMSLTTTLLPTTVAAQTRMPDRLSIVQFCNAQGFKCKLRFVDSYQGDDVIRVVRAYLAQSGDTGLGEQVTVQANCSPGWAASVHARQGTISDGGLIATSATVCGHPDPVLALQAALQACDEQSGGMCKNANHVQAIWGEWTGVTASKRSIEPGRPYDPLNYPDGQQCISTVPIYSTSACLPQAVEQLRAAGMK